MDIITRLESDHRLLLMAAGRVLIQTEQEWEGVPGSRPGEALDLLRRLKVRLARHEEIEDRLLHPALRACCPGCAGILDGLEIEHRGIASAVELLLREMEAGASETSLRPALVDFDRRLRRHLFHEEHRVLSLAEREIPVAELMRLGSEAEFSVIR